MNWGQAKKETLELWLKIRDSLGHSYQADLLSDVNLICTLCEKATEARIAAGEPPESVKCDYCPAYEQFGGCKEVCAEISTRVAEKDWDAARTIADRFIANLRTLEVPADRDEGAADASHPVG